GLLRRPRGLSPISPALLPSARASNQLLLHPRRSTLTTRKSLLPTRSNSYCRHHH
ncbi:hypothetical protein GGI14_006214, partial [Coemansia sp. S680]